MKTFQEMLENLESVEECLEECSSALDKARNSDNIDILNTNLESLEKAARKIVVDIMLHRSHVQKDLELQKEEYEYEQEIRCSTACEACGVPYTIGHCDDCPLRD